MTLFFMEGLNLIVSIKKELSSKETTPVIDLMYYKLSEFFI